MRHVSHDAYLHRGPPFVEVDGDWYLNVAFELPAAVSSVAANSSDPMVLRRLTASETKLLRDRRLDTDLEVWARITA